MIAVIDYGMGNLRSVQKALEAVGAKAVITHDPALLTKAQKAVLPGVGALRPAMERLEKLKLVQAIREFVDSGRAFLGICLGFQLLFEKSEEGGRSQGLALLKGDVLRFNALKVPHMGWNQINVKKTDCALFRGLDAAPDVYFCHSYYVRPQDSRATAATTDYGVEFASGVWQNNIFGVQFHPEKSQQVGLRILKNFNEVSL